MPEVAINEISDQAKLNEKQSCHIDDGQSSNNPDLHDSVDESSQNNEINKTNVPNTDFNNSRDDMNAPSSYINGICKYKYVIYKYVSLTMLTKKDHALKTLYRKIAIFIFQNRFLYQREQWDSV